MALRKAAQKRGPDTDALVIKLYSGSADIEPEQFPAWALRQLQPATALSSATWEILGPAGSVMAATHPAPVTAPTERAAELATERATELDGVASPRDGRIPGNSLPLAADRLLQFTLPCKTRGRKHRFSFLCLERKAGFQADEQRRLGALARHLVAAYELACRCALDRARHGAPDGHDHAAGTALVSRRGRILASDRRFRAHMKAADPQWDGVSLPAPIAWEPQQAKRVMEFRGLILTLYPQGQEFRLRVRKDVGQARVSQRQRLIAQRVVEGRSFKAIGLELGLAPSTVSSHLYNLYARTRLQHRSQLKDWLAREARSVEAGPRGSAGSNSRFPEWWSKQMATSFRLVPSRQKQP